jgi:hypothetical protein
MSLISAPYIASLDGDGSTLFVGGDEHPFTRYLAVDHQV